MNFQLRLKLQKLRIDQLVYSSIYSPQVNSTASNLRPALRDFGIASPPSLPTPPRLRWSRKLRMGKHAGGN